MKEPLQATERPILFSTPMVGAILAGNKTQTRRVVKFPLKSPTHHVSINDSDTAPPASWCPYGQPGDRLWVRENWFVNSVFDQVPPRDLDTVRENCLPEWFYNYTASDEKGEFGGKTRPAIHMPRAACRLVLEITNIRVERLQDISEADAIAEGVKLHERGEKWLNYVDQAGGVTQFIYNLRSAKESFRTLWSHINGWESYWANPWVWVVEFRRVEA